MSDRTFDLLLKQDVTGKTAQIHLSQELYDVTKIRIKLPTNVDIYGSMKHPVRLKNLAEGTVVDWGADNARSVAGADGTLSYSYDLGPDDLPSPTISIYGRILSGGAPFPPETTEIIKLGNIDDAAGLFDSVIELTKIDDVEGFQRICDKSTSLKSCFRYCTSLREIPEGLFDHCTEVTDFSDCFSACSYLMKVPAGLFDHCTKATNFSSCFSSCSSLPIIPAGLFDHCTAVTDFSNCFFYCRSLTTIPAGLFDHCTAAKSFFNCFGTCPSLTDIPAGLFDQCHYVTSFNNCFNGCGKIKAIPEGLFDHCSSVTGFASCFAGCQSLTAIPTSLFDNCTEVARFNDCFNSCSNVTGESPYSMLSGKKVRLWERADSSRFRLVTKHAGCFSHCTGLTDYAEIPADWK